MKKLWSIIFLFSFVGTVWATHYRTIPAPATNAAAIPASLPRNGPRFIVGVFEQPTYNFADLNILGINTLVGIPLNHPAIPWAQAATDQGFYQIRPPVGVPSLDEKNPFWIAWEQQDEPDLHATPQADMDAVYSKAKAIGIPVFTNFDGSRLLGIQPPAFGLGASYANIVAKTDWVSTDIYPISGWNGNVSLWSPGHAVDASKVLGGPDKQYLMYIECCQQDKWRGPTVLEMRTIQAQAERRKLRGVIYFSINFNLKWGGEPGKPNAFFGPDDEHREEIGTYCDTHAN